MIAPRDQQHKIRKRIDPVESILLVRRHVLLFSKIGDRNRRSAQRNNNDIGYDPDQIYAAQQSAPSALPHMYTGR